MTGHTYPGRPTVMAIADDGLARRPDGKLHLDRVVTEWRPDGRCHVRRDPAQGSHQLAVTALADAIAEVPDGSGSAAGGDVRVHLL